MKPPCARGVRHAALFGSRARGDNQPGSDIDIMIEFEPDASIDLFEYIAITQCLARLSVEGLKTDWLASYAVTRALEIISEAARRLPPDLRERHPDLPWRAIMGVGNVYRHDYDNVAEEFVWRMQHSLPALMVVIADEIARLGDP